MFLFKKIVSPFFYPLPLCVEILLLGLILLWFTRKQKTGKAFVSIGVILLVALSHNAVTDRLLGPLEYKYPPLKSMAPVSDVRWVVVLGEGYSSDTRLPVTSQLSGGSLARLVEGIRLQRMVPGSRLVLSGGGALDPVPSARVMANVALALEVKEEDIVLESLSKDTKDEARLIQEIVRGDRFVLVTSASHMPRSVALFRKLGMAPIPAPTDHWVKRRQRMSPGRFFPSTADLFKAKKAFHEYLGLAWATIWGQI
jgi:uncharacterized SAM-binding protein YcdF (DUF218 family)